MRNIPQAENRLYITFNLNEVIFASSQDQNIFSFYKNHFPKGINIKNLFTGKFFHRSET